MTDIRNLRKVRPLHRACLAFRSGRTCLTNRHNEAAEATKAPVALSAPNESPAVPATPETITVVASLSEKPGRALPTC